MLNDEIDFEYNIEQLNKPLTLDIKKQNAELDSDRINSTFQSIEDDLNTLYQKTRYLEEVIDYAKTFISLKIDEYTSQMNATIKSIENIKKVSKNLGYIEYNVPFKQNTFAIADRNKNYKINPCKLKETNIDEIKNDLIILDDRVCLNHKYNSLVRKCEQIPYDENLNDLLLDKNYKVTYIEEKPIQNGVTETITIYLSEPSEVNELDISPINCSVENIRYIYANGIEENAGKYVTGIEPESRVTTHIKFDLKCMGYNTVVYELDTDKMTTNIWNYLKLTEFYKGDISLSKMSKAIENEKDKEITSDILVSRTETNIANQVSYTAYKKAPNKVMKVTMYTYNFGLDRLKVNRINQFEDGYFISDPINIGSFNEGEYIQLDVDDCSQEACCIEYSILDGDVEKYIMPINSTFIDNEKIFPENNLRFTVDYDIYGDGLKQIKKDGINVQISLDDAKLQYDGRYSADYLPVYEYYKYTPINSSIRIKAVMRTFGNIIPVVPYIKNINIRKYGGSTLWTTLY